MIRPADSGRPSPLVPSAHLQRWCYALFEALAVYVAHIAVFSWLYGGGGLPLGVDGYYHFTIASQLSLGQPAIDINTLPFTALGPNGPDAHWLIHWLQKPLTLVSGSPNEAIHLATLHWGALAPAMLTLVMRLGDVRMAPLFAVLGCWSLYSLPERFLMFRAQNFAVVLLALLAVLAGKRKLVAFAVAVFFFNHSYQGVILAGLVVGATLAAEALVWRRLDTRLITAAAIGLFLSIITSPWFPGNLHYFVVVTIGRLLNPITDASLMGAEWFSMDAAVAFKAGIVAHLCVVAGLLALVSGRSRIVNRQEAVLPVLFNLLALAFLVLYLRHWRMGEFYGPFAALALGFTLSWLLPRPAPALRAMLASVCLGVLALHQYSLAPQPDYRADRLAQHCSYLQTNAGTGDMVFNTSWVHYPSLLWCAPNLKFVSGLDGLLLAQGDTRVFNQWYLLNKSALELIDPVVMKRELARTSARFILVKPGSPGVSDFLLRHLPGAAVAVATEEGVLLDLPEQALPETVSE